VGGSVQISQDSIGRWSRINQESLREEVDMKRFEEDLIRVKMMTDDDSGHTTGSPTKTLSLGHLWLRRS